MAKTVKFPNGMVLKSEWYEHPWMTSQGKIRAERQGGGPWKGFKSWRTWLDAQIDEAQQYAMEGV